jgi:hypothetical protein
MATAGPDHPSVARTLEIQANLLDEAANHVAATPIRERVVAIQSKAFGSAHPAVAVAHAHLGDTRLAAGDRAGAERAYERALATRATRSFFVADKEVELFQRLAPECAARVESMGNGVDADFFAPAAARASPFQPGEQAIVFTGAMDYWPNVDAVVWFTAEVLPALRAQRPACRADGRTGL